jgi:hypothetical protein
VSAGVSPSIRLFQRCRVLALPSLDLESSTDAVSNARIQLMPELERLLSSLVAKAASATERTSDMASQALVHVACHTPIGPRCVAQVIMGAKSSDAVRCFMCWNGLLPPCPLDRGFLTGWWLASVGWSLWRP